jgi:hypothetical protein
MRDFCSGGGETSDTAAMHARWSYVARLFFSAVNRENGTLQHLPYAGSVMDQPARTLAVFELMQGAFMENLKAQMDRK